MHASRLRYGSAPDGEEEEEVTQREIDDYVANQRRLERDHGALVALCASDRLRAKIWHLAHLLPNDTEHTHAERFISMLLLIAALDDSEAARPALIRQAARLLVRLVFIKERALS
jgi:hypothetical protein